jgi:hypothetical protein
VAFRSWNAFEFGDRSDASAARDMADGLRVLHDVLGIDVPERMQLDAPRVR